MVLHASEFCGSRWGTIRFVTPQCDGNSNQTHPWLSARHWYEIGRLSLFPKAQLGCCFLPDTSPDSPTAPFRNFWLSIRFLFMCLANQTYRQSCHVNPNSSVSVQNPRAFQTDITHVAAGFLSSMQFCFICNVRSLGSAQGFLCNGLNYGLHKLFLLLEGCFLTKVCPFSSLFYFSVSLPSSLPSVALS